MFTHSAKIRMPIHMAAANVQSPTSQASSAKLNTCIAAMNRFDEQMVKTRDFRMSSFATSSVHA